MTEQTNEITLEDVRNRFLDAETRLTETVAAVAAIQEAAGHLGAAREGLGVAGERLGGLAGSMEEVASALTDNATHLREGVDAIRAGDPAEIRRQIEELDAAFTAMQSVVGDRLTKIEQEVAAQVVALGAHMATSRREARIIAAGLAVLMIVSIAVTLLP